MATAKSSNDNGSVFPTLGDLLETRVVQEPQKIIFTILEDGETVSARLSYADLHQQSHAIAAYLAQNNAVGERALLLFPPGVDYLVGFFGCLAAGVTAVPAYPPDPTRLKRMLPRLQAIAADAEAKIVLTTTPILNLAHMMFDLAPEMAALTWVAIDQDIPLDLDWPLPQITPDTLAFLQYTSGSTGKPKGVMLTHANLLHNEALITQGFRSTPDDRLVIWLPPYHDMGLIGGILQPLYTGFPCVIMPPVAFLQRPFRWLKAISDHQATVSGGPNFAYDLCIRKISRRQRETLDLSRWRVAFNGAEPVRRETLDRFAATFEEVGFQRSAFSPCYGLAEATLFASGGINQKSPIVREVQKSALAKNTVTFASTHDRAFNKQSLVGCGQSPATQQMIIVHQETKIQLPDDKIGEVWIAGDSVAQGYWKRPEETAVTFHARLATGEGPFLRTGDLGFLHQGELFITGRVKDLIIIRGRNHYPQDIEATVEHSHPGIRPGCSAAFSVDVGREERLIVAAEVYTNKPVDLEDLIQMVRRAVANQHEVQVYAVVLLQPRTIPKTSSGKIQRHACRREYLDKKLAVVEANILENVASFQKEKQHAPESLLVKALKAMEPTSRHALITSHLQELMAQVAGFTPDQLNAQRPLPSLGLDSAMAVELTHEIESALGVPLRMEYMLQDITISEFASQLVVELTAPPEPEPILAPKTDRTRPSRHPMSAGQRALWFLHQLDPNSPAYNVVYGVRLLAPIRLDALNDALQEIVNRHDTLRTTFTTNSAGNPIQIVHPHKEIKVTSIDASTWDDAQLNGRLSQELFRPFDLAKGPLLRFLIFQQTAETSTVLLAMHHIITDLWSLALILHELDVLYQAAAKGRPAALKPLKITFADYVHRQNGLLADKGDELRAYWLKQLAGDLPVLNLLPDKPRPPQPTFHGRCESMVLDKNLVSRLKTLGKQHNATLFMTLLAAYQVLLHLYTGQDDILVGSPKANRTRDVARMVGYFVNPIVIRGDLSQTPSFNTFLPQIRQTTLAAFTHSDYPFPHLVEQLQPMRESSHMPIFQTMFAWQKTTQLVNSTDIASFLQHEQGQQIRLGDIPLETIALPDWVSPFDLTLLMAEAGDTLIATFEYSIDLFEPETIRRMLDHFEQLLEKLVAQPDTPIAQISLLTGADKQIMWADGEAERPFLSPELVPDIISQVAQRQPQAAAVQMAEQTITYAELDLAANQLAAYLQASGVQPGEPVGLLHGRSPAAIIAILAILKAGAAYLPIEQTIPLKRLHMLVEDAQIRTLITEFHYLPLLSGLSLNTISLDSDQPRIARTATDTLKSAYMPDSTAYIIYTSGSTGKPKGVEVDHQAITQHCQIISDHFELTPADRVLQFAAFSFDQSIEQILATLTSGGTLVMRGDTIWEPELFPSVVQDKQLTVINLPPAYWQQVVTAWCSTQTPADHLRLVIIGGDVLPPDTITQWQQSPIQHVRVLNAYGPTETSITATTHELTANQPAATRLPIGRPLPHRIALILDRHGNPVPIGIPGELHLGGVGVARGYLNRPQLTAEKFIELKRDELRIMKDEKNSSLIPPPSSLFYKTGDLCRLLPDGTIEFLGRLDNQVKVRGFRIELGEIEAALAAHPQVQQTAVLAHTDARDSRLVAYLGMPDAQKPSARELRQFVKKHLPEYMVPNNFVILDELPLLPSGKINRRALSTVESAPIEQREETAVPRTPVEEQLTALWREVLNVPVVGIHDNFFDLGGHSLLATRLASQVREQFQVDLSLRDMFSATTVADLAALIMQHQAAQVNEEELEVLLNELEDLSPDDMQSMLKETL